MTEQLALDSFLHGYLVSRRGSMEMLYTILVILVILIIISAVFGRGRFF